PESETRLLDETDRSKSVRRFAPRTIRIHDARPIARDFSIEKNGFELVTQKTACKDFSDAAHVSTVYFREIEKLIKERTGAERVLIFGPALRTDSPSRGADVRQPATAPHVDYSEKMVRYFIGDMLGEAEAERLKSRRVMLINVWRPLRTVERSPLALCDAATVTRDDLVLAYVKGSVASKPGEEPLVSEGYNVFFNEAQRWYYFPRQQADEVLVFRLCDSDRDAIQLTAHTAFDDPTGGPDAAYRQSYEIRTIAIMPPLGFTEPHAPP
ncbi:MAG TPA: CmcJ/NvfI family oxidoreductase, partial [Xanthobacteraceae bacterium]|nr:CmcJ/NvfI family oxidoreductase [Xanthobacteraceae bacterium]